MENQFTNKMLESLSRICEEAKGCELKSESFKSIEPNLDFISKNLQIPTLESFFFALLFNLNLEEDGVTFQHLGDLLKCSAITLLHYNKQIETLIERNLVELKKNNSFRNKGRQTYQINEEVKTAVLNEEFPLKNLKKEPPSSVVDLLAEFYDQACKCDEGDIKSYELQYIIVRLLDTNRQFKYVQSLLNFTNLETSDLGLFLYVSWKTLCGNEQVNLSRSIEGIVTDNSARVRFSQSIIKGENPLIKLKLVEVVKGGFLNSAELKLSEKGIALLEEEGLTLSPGNPEKSLLTAEKIQKKELFYGPEEMQQIQMLEQTLQEEKLNAIQKRLQNNSLPKGVTVILHGPPGTGKTESVYQIARKTGRSIFKVDISESKSKWFGESEKLIKDIFTRYKSAAKKEPLLPILLFNEADALLSTRRESATNVSQTENAIQNILLEELENFEGIFIATTNLVKNLDPAFERRFLFKIKFNCPTISVKQKIWQNRLSFLSPVQTNTLAENYSLSGGQIENICRKIMMQEVITGTKIDFREITGFCDVELFGGNPEVKRIGFGS